MRVLLVDDQCPFLVLARKIIGQMPGFQVVGEAMDGSTAIRLADELLPDLILMDVLMPEMNGFQTAARILRRHPQTRIVMLSAYEENGFEQLLKKVKVTGFIGKAEFDANSLLSLLGTSSRGG